MINQIKLSRRTKHPRRISPLTLKILAVNIGAIFMLAMGFLYTVQYEDKLIETELNALRQEAQLIAAALSEGGTRQFLNDDAFLARDLSQLMVRKISSETDFRIILFNKGGELIADSHRLSGVGGAVQIIELPPPAHLQSWHVHMQNNLTATLRHSPIRLNLASFPDIQAGQVQTYPNMIETLQGGSYQQAWHDENRNILLSVTYPVARLKQVIGGLMLIRTGERVEAAISDLQLNVIRIFLATLLITSLLSVYLATTIAAPIRKLSIAADRMRVSKNPELIIPDLSDRNDEIGDLSISLRHLTNALNARLLAIESFAADVAHELKNPLASIQSAMETLPKAQDKKSRERLEAIIFDDIKRLDRLITDISAASKLDAELNRIEKHPVDMMPMLKNIAEGYQERLGDKAMIEFITPLSNKQAMVNGDEARLGQVFMNILNNALSFSPKNKPIKIRLNKDFKEIIISIENQGSSIPEKKLETIFNRFYSERPSEENFGQHSGLGLSISKQIVLAHNGEIRAENMYDKKGNYTAVRFIVTLPLYNA